MKRLLLVLCMLCSLALILTACGTETATTSGGATKTEAAATKVKEDVPTAVPDGIPVLMYHKVGPDRDNDAVIREDLFREQMKFLHDNGFHPLTMEQLNDYVRHGKAVPVKPVVLTFDDGYEDTYTIVYPVLKEYGFAGTVYINPGDMGTRLTWEQVKEMKDNGITIASHGYDHIRMTDLSESEQLNNIVKAQVALKEKLDIDNQWFCYPYGRVTEYTEKAVADNGIKLATTMNPGWVHVGDNPYALKRIWIGNAVDIEHFKERITTEKYTDL
ncbi:polysaccharide deacetylase family protein [uncultured Veillonella sp.]|uniref:polysaccharide deacetylase family protein n=1 Tax=uncultured Veillonella sp. TaxID=159268 RepID=UPI0025FED469|nr:polysaccharide deacetylase family protein [uncultured Veillonella sp.]